MSSRDPWSRAFLARMTDDACSHACVYVGAGNLSSGLYACTAITLLTESLPRYYHWLSYSVSFYPYWTIMLNDAEFYKNQSRLDLDHVILWEEGREDTHCSLLANICVPKRASTASLWLDTVLLYQSAKSASSGSKIVWQAWLSHSRWNLQAGPWLCGRVLTQHVQNPWFDSQFWKNENFWWHKKLLPPSVQDLEASLASMNGRTGESCIRVESHPSKSSCDVGGNGVKGAISISVTSEQLKINVQF